MTTRGEGSGFVVGRQYENRQGRFTVLATGRIEGRWSLQVEYQDGTQAWLDAEIQERIVSNLRREREAEARRRTSARAPIVRVPSLPRPPQPAPRPRLTGVERRLDRLNRLDLFMQGEGWPREVRGRVLGLVETGYLRLITGPFGGFGLALGEEPAASAAVAAAQQSWLLDPWRGRSPPMFRALLDLLPMPPDEGPPLPRRLERRWAQGGMRLRYGK